MQIKYVCMCKSHDCVVIPHSYVVPCRHPKSVGHSRTQASQFVVPLASEVTFSENVGFFALMIEAHDQHKLHGQRHSE